MAGKRHRLSRREKKERDKKRKERKRAKDNKKNIEPESEFEEVEAVEISPPRPPPPPQPSRGEKKRERHRLRQLKRRRGYEEVPVEHGEVRRPPPLPPRPVRPPVPARRKDMAMPLEQESSFLWRRSERQTLPASVEAFTFPSVIPDGVYDDIPRADRPYRYEQFFAQIVECIRELMDDHRTLPNNPNVSMSEGSVYVPARFDGDLVTPRRTRYRVLAGTNRRGQPYDLNIINLVLNRFARPVGGGPYRPARYAIRFQPLLDIDWRREVMRTSWASVIDRYLGIRYDRDSNSVLVRMDDRAIQSGEVFSGSDEVDIKKFIIVNHGEERMYGSGRGRGDRYSSEDISLPYYFYDPEGERWCAIKSMHEGMNVVKLIPTPTIPEMKKRSKGLNGTDDPLTPGQVVKLADSYAVRVRVIIRCDIRITQPFHEEYVEDVIAESDPSDRPTINLVYSDNHYRLALGRLHVHPVTYRLVPRSRVPTDQTPSIPRVRERTLTLRDQLNDVIYAVCTRIKDGFHFECREPELYYNVLFHLLTYPGKPRRWRVRRAASFVAEYEWILQDRGEVNIGRDLRHYSRISPDDDSFHYHIGPYGTAREEILITEEESRIVDLYHEQREEPGFLNVGFAYHNLCSKGDRSVRMFAMDVETSNSYQGNTEVWSCAAFSSEYCDGGFVGIPESCCFIKPTAVSETLDWIERTGLRDNVILTYNGGRFDNYFIIRDVLRRRQGKETEPELLMGNNKILSFSWKVAYEQGDQDDGHYKTFRLIDVLNYVSPGSLDSTAKSLGVPSKKDFDHNLIQDMRDRSATVDDFFSALHSNPAEVERFKEYNVQDCKTTLQVYYVMRDLFLKNTNIDIGRKRGALTAPGVINKKFRHDITGDTPILTPIYETELERWNWMRRSMYGGRSQMFHVGGHEGVFAMFDVVSLYPFVMLAMPYPIGPHTLTDEYKVDKIGIYNCDILRQPLKNIIPYRDPNGVEPLNWTYAGEMRDVVLTSVDILCIRDYSGEDAVVVRDGIYWEDSIDSLFSGTLGPIKAEKQAQDVLKDTKDPRYSASVRAVSKLMLNSLYGKMMEKPHFNKQEFVSSPAVLQSLNSRYGRTLNVSYIGDTLPLYVEYEIPPTTEAEFQESVQGKSEKEVEKERRKLGKLSQVHIGSLILSYARGHMYRAAIHPLNIFSMDTDGFTCDMTDKKTMDYVRPRVGRMEGKTLYDRWGQFNIGSEFGDFTDEYKVLKITDTPMMKRIRIADGPKYRRLYTIRSKVYGIFGDEGVEPVMKMKGISYRPASNDKQASGDRDFQVLNDEVLTRYTSAQIDSSPSAQARVKEYRTMFARMTLREKRDLYESSPPMLNEEVYRRVAAGYKVAVINAGFKRRLKQAGDLYYQEEGLQLCYGYTVKIISPSN